MKRPTDLPTRNVELLQTTMRQIEQNPETHDQGRWITACRTAFCYAGHAAILAGALPPAAAKDEFGSFWAIDPTTCKSALLSAYDLRESSKMPVDVFAAKRLGITGAEAEVLFAGDRTIPELRALVDALCDGAWIDDGEYVHVGEERTYVDYWLIGQGVMESFE